MDWSRDVAIPARETIKQMKLEQTQLRNDLFQNPANIEATLADVLHAQCHEKSIPASCKGCMIFPVKMLKKESVFEITVLFKKGDSKLFFLWCILVLL